MSELAVMVSLIGFAIAGIGLFGICAPSTLTNCLARWRVLTQLPVTLGLRVILGNLLLLAVSESLRPTVVGVFGVLELAAAVVLLVAGPRPLASFVTWWLQRSPAFVRWWCLGTVAYGMALAYSGA